MIGNKDILSYAYVTRCQLALEEFKSCPLCEAINVAEDDECFLCGWHGQFVHDPDVIEQGLYEIVYRCPELLAVLVEEIKQEKPTFWRRMQRFFGRFRRKIDVRI
ncbi:MAG TPA: hypothetical protein VNI20_05110 [Fimbriimonadaceae bacterium]|nr:hypothetical protein [Fimbriimonadaceae bacterium]